MRSFKIISAVLLLFIVINANAQTGKESKRDTKGRIELSFQIGYSGPQYEAYGNNMTINETEDRIFLNGKSILISDNLGANSGLTVQTYFKYSILQKGYLKALFNIGYNVLTGSYPGPSGYDIGVRLQSFSAGLGAEVNPIGHEKTFYPGVYGLLRMNLVGGETYHKAGIDFFKVTPRYGYSAGIKLNYNLKKTLGIYLGYSYSYDNLWNKQTEDEAVPDPYGHVIDFRDKQSSANELTHDRRVVYWSLFLGMNFFFK
jgi:hypothetical protein